MSETLLVVVLVLVAVGAVAFPLVAGRQRYGDREELEADVARYRAALEARTVCELCREANPPGSRYCRDCGAELAEAP